MSILHLNILDDHRLKLIPKLTELPRGGALGGGTALALFLGHRRSYDFDLFYAQPISKTFLLRIRKLFAKRLTAVMVDTSEELTIELDGEVKLTLLYFPFKPLFSVKHFSGFPTLFDPRDLASNKAYAIGRRGTWRDYVDIHAWISSGHTLDSVIKDAEKRFAGAFSSRLFLEQLTYTKDLGSFVVDFLSSFNVSQQTIEKDLSKAVSDYLARHL